MSSVGDITLRKIRNRLILFIVILYVAAFVDRVNLGFAAAQMQRDLGFSAYLYGFGAGIFFIGYCLFEVPSNLMLHRIGGRRWIARIMLTWAVLAGAMAWVRGPIGFCTLRFLLGVAEAGFFPGVIYYLTYWVPAADRARMIGLFMTAIPIATALAGPLSGAILRLDGRSGLAGWQWLFLLETLPSLLLGLATLRVLTDRPAQADWLTDDERRWLAQRLEADSVGHGLRGSVLQALIDPRILLLSFCYFGVELGLYGVILWVPQILASVGIGADRVGYAIAIPYLTAAAGMVWWCRHSDRAGERTWHILAASVVGFAGLAGSAWLRNSPLWSVVAVTAGAAGTLAILPIFWTLPTALLRGAAAAGGIALINAIGNIGGFAGPFALGWIQNATGNFSLGLAAMAGGVLFTGVTAVMMRGDQA